VYWNSWGPKVITVIVPPWISLMRTASSTA
jgi:hypothetical protein